MPVTGQNGPVTGQAPPASTSDSGASQDRRPAGAKQTGPEPARQKGGNGAAANRSPKGPKRERPSVNRGRDGVESSGPNAQQLSETPRGRARLLRLDREGREEASKPHGEPERGR